MGRYGSGRRHETAKLDEGLRLDINKLKRDGVLAFNTWRSGSLKWTRVSTGDEIGSIGYEANTLDPDDMWIRAHYTHTSYWDDEPNNMDYKIRLEATQPNYNGKRLWFRCPSTQRRASILYSPPGSKWFASRYAFKHLKYSSQSKSPQDRAIDKMWKLKHRLNDDGDYWLKPKGMHWKKFHRLCDEIDEAEDICDGYLAQFIARKLGFEYS